MSASSCSVIRRTVRKKESRRDMDARTEFQHCGLHLLLLRLQAHGLLLQRRLLLLYARLGEEKTVSVGA
jgi:hypothetical protein